MSTHAVRIHVASDLKIPRCLEGQPGLGRTLPGTERQGRGGIQRRRVYVRLPCLCPSRHQSHLVSVWRFEQFWRGDHSDTSKTTFPFSSSILLDSVWQKKRQANEIFNSGSEPSLNTWMNWTLNGVWSFYSLSPDRCRFDF